MLPPAGALWNYARVPIFFLSLYSLKLLGVLPFLPLTIYSLSLPVWMAACRGLCHWHCDRTDAVLSY